MIRKHSFLSVLICFGVVLFSNPLLSFAQQESYGVGSWDSDSLGNHRVVVNVSDSAATAARAKVTWRRRDKNPHQKRIIVVDGNTGQKIQNVQTIDINRISGDIIFEPASGAGTYYIYYMPYEMQGKWYPKVDYRTSQSTAQSNWLQKHGLDKNGANSNIKNVSAAEVEEIQSIDQFNSFYPMEVVASEDELQKLESKFKNDPYLLFPEKRTHSIRMFEDLPYKWIQEGPSTKFYGKASRGEFYVFQVGVYAFKNKMNDIEVAFEALQKDGGGNEVAATNFSSFNTEGTNWDGRPFDKMVPVGKGNVQPLWIGVQIPESASAGMYKGTMTIKPQNMPSQTVDLSIDVLDDVITDAGDNDIWRLSRLRWLNSKIAFDNSVVEPFIPIEQQENRLNILGRSVELGKNGLPQQVESYFSPGVTDIREESRKLLSDPLQFIVTDASGEEHSLTGDGINYMTEDEGLVSWNSTGRAGGLNFETEGELESDGYMHYKVTLKANEKTSLQDIRMEIPVIKEAAKYMMGLGQKGGYRPDKINWKWDQTRHQEGAWIGDVNIGFQYQLRDTNYERPLNTNFYQQQPLNMPPSWYNQGRGGTDITETNNETVLVKSYSGKRTIEKGEEIHFVFNLLLTPFKTINASKHWKNRYYHAFEPVSEVAKTGASVINVHHANNVNPYINYPFIHTKEMKKYVDLAHLSDMEVKIYYTIRELSNRVPELFALRSMGNEFISSGDGGGYSWLQEHLGDDYIAGWFVPRWKDAAVVNSGMSRWHNYYVEGLDWLVQNMEIDGLYIDDLAFDRTTMKRVRKVLNKGEGTQLIDMHSANQYNERDGYTNSANLYMEHFPYIDRLWFGEYFEYDLGPDYWLVETSGIPFGLMGQMLQGGGNPWRGMIYGMTARAPWSGNPKPFWRLWDDFGIQEAQMIGYWAPNAPIVSGHANVKATSYVRDGEKTLVVLASWAENTVEIIPQVDWDAIGLDSSNAIIEVPEIGDLQQANQLQVGESISIKPAEGKILIIKKKQ